MDNSSIIKKGDRVSHFFAKRIGVVVTDPVKTRIGDSIVKVVDIDFGDHVARQQDVAYLLRVWS